MSVPSSFAPHERAAAAAAAAATETRERDEVARWGWLLTLAVAAGIVCRLAQYAADQSFWIDEASLLLNIRSHTAAQLFGPLDYNQAAPPLFLLAGRALYQTLGGSEYALRVLPLACGIAALVIFALLSRRLLDPPWDAVATALFALGDRLIWHSTEVKQYGTDVLVAVLLTYLAIGPRANWSATRRFIWVAAVATVGAWFSYTAMLVFAAMAAAFCPRPRGKGAAPLPFVIASALAAASFVFVVRTVVRAQQTGSLTTYWYGDFIDLHRPWTLPLWLVRHLHALCNYAVPGTGTVILVGMIAGAVWLWRSGKFEELVILLGPLLVALAAATAHRYPFDGGRLTCFLCGSILLLAVIGLRWAHSALLSRGRLIAIAPAGFVLGVAIVSGTMHLALPRNRGHLRPVVAFLREHMQPGDDIYVLNDWRVFIWYWPSSDARVRFQLGPADHVPARRFWIVWGFSNDTGKRRLDPVLRWAGTFATRREQVYTNGGAGVLMERDDRTVPPLPDQPPATEAGTSQ